MTTQHAEQQAAGKTPRERTETTNVDLAELHAVTLAAAREFIKPPRRTAALVYLRQRGVDTGNLPQQWPLGYAPPGWTRLVDTLRHRFSDDALLATGLARRSSRGSLIDAFRDRVIFPVHDYNATIVGFIGRDLSGQENAPKYVNSATSELYRKGELLYGDIEHALSGGRIRGAQPVLVEGPVDVLTIVARAHAEGRDDLLPIGASGTAVTSTQADRITQLAFAAETSVVIALDGDAAGHAAALRTGDELRTRGVDAKLAVLSQGSDPAAYLTRRDSNLYTFHASQAMPLLTAHVEATIAAQGDRMQWIEGRLAAARIITANLATYPVSHAARQVGWIANALNLDAAVMTFELSNAYRSVADRGLPIATRSGNDRSPHERQLR